MNDNLEILKNPEFTVKFAELLSQQNEIEKYNNASHEEIYNEFLPDVLQFIENEFKLIGINTPVQKDEIIRIINIHKNPCFTFLPNNTSSFGDLCYSLSSYITTSYREYMISYEPIMHLLSDKFKISYRDYVTLNINTPEDETSVSSRIQKEILSKYEARNLSRLNLYKTQWNTIDKEFKELMSNYS